MEEWVHSRNDELENVERAEFSRERMPDSALELATLFIISGSQSEMMHH